MAKTWDEMTLEEKIEDLRRDVVTLFSEANTARQSLTALAQHLDQTTQTAREALAAVAALRDRLVKNQKI